MNIPEAIHFRFTAVKEHSSERQLRVWAAAEARAYGRGGIAVVSEVTGIARSTICRGLKDLDDPDSLTGTVRRPGAGRPEVTADQPNLLADLQALLEPATIGDPMRPLLWVSKSQVKLAGALRDAGYHICPNSVARLIEQLDYRRQGN